jgi:hypothetical protein
MTATTLDQHAPVGAPPHRHRSVWLRAGWIRAAWMTALFWGIGLGLVLIFRWWAGWEPLFKWDVITVVATLTAQNEPLSLREKAQNEPLSLRERGRGEGKTICDFGAQPSPPTPLPEGEGRPTYHLPAKINFRQRLRSRQQI